MRRLVALLPAVILPFSLRTGPRSFMAGDFAKSFMVFGRRKAERGGKELRSGSERVLGAGVGGL